MCHSIRRKISLRGIPMRHLVFIPVLLFSAICHKALATELSFSTFEGSPIQGLSALILDEAYQSLDIPIKVTSFPGKKSLITAHMGLVDGEVSRVDDLGQGSPNMLIVPESINYFETTIFTKEIELVVSDWNTLKPYLIGVTLGAKSNQQHTKDFQRIMSPSYPQLFNMLNQEQIELAVSPLINGLAVLRQYRFKELKPLNDSLVKTELFHYLHKKHEPLIPQITEAIKRMKRTGEIDQMRQRFIARMKQFN